MSLSDHLFMQRLVEQLGVENIVIVADNARTPSTSVTRNKQLRSLRRPRRWNSSDGLARVVHGTRRRGVKRENTYPACRWEPACKDKLPVSPPMSLRGLSNTTSMVDFVMKLPSRHPDSPSSSDSKSTVDMINDVLSELNILEDLTA